MISIELRYGLNIKHYHNGEVLISSNYYFPENPTEKEISDCKENRHYARFPNWRNYREVCSVFQDVQVIKRDL